MSLAGPLTKERKRTKGNANEGGKQRRIIQADGTDLQLDRFVPVDDVTRNGERFDVDDVHVAFLRADVEPLALERQMETSDPDDGKRRYVTIDLCWIAGEKKGGSLTFPSET